MVLGREVAPVSEYRVGVTLRWISAGSVATCFRRPRRPRAIWWRVRVLLAPRRPSTTFTNLRLGGLRHLAGITLHNAAARVVTWRAAHRSGDGQEGGVLRRA
jgi:hypothetical protein